MNADTKAEFDQRYQTHLKHLKLKGLQPKTIDAYARAIRRMGEYFGHQIDNLSPAQLTDYFSDLIASHSWSAVKLDLYGFKFYTLHVLNKPWAMPNFIKPPKVSRLPDIVTVEEAQALFCATHMSNARSVGWRFCIWCCSMCCPRGFAPTERPKLLCRCCGGVMRIVRRRILPVIAEPPGVQRNGWEMTTR